MVTHYITQVVSGWQHWTRSCPGRSAACAVRGARVQCAVREVRVQVCAMVRDPMARRVPWCYGYTHVP